MSDRTPSLRTQLVRLLDDTTPAVTAQEAIDRASSHSDAERRSSALVVDDVDSKSARRHSRLITRPRIGVALLAAAIVAVFVAAHSAAVPLSTITERRHAQQCNSLSRVRGRVAERQRHLAHLRLGGRQHRQWTTDARTILRWNGSSWDRVQIPTCTSRAA